MFLFLSFDTLKLNYDGLSGDSVQSPMWIWWCKFEFQPPFESCEHFWLWLMD